MIGGVRDVWLFDGIGLVFDCWVGGFVVVGFWCGGFVGLYR